MTASERIKELLKYKGMNVKTFSESVGYERPQAIYDLINGKTRNISQAMSQRILQTLPEVSRLWLLTGEGPMLEGAESQAGPSVPMVSIQAIAGPLTAYYESGEDLEHCERVACQVAGAELAIRVTGDSMEPAYADGTVVYVKRINEAAFIPWGHTLVIDTENGVYIKNVLPDPDNPQYVWAESTNPKYPAMHVPTASIRGMYRVLATAHT